MHESYEIFMVMLAGHYLKNELYKCHSLIVQMVEILTAVRSAQSNAS